jgi:hypothetical protein
MRVDEAAGGTTEVVLIVDPRAAAQRTGIFIFIIPILHPLPDIAPAMSIKPSGVVASTF